MDERYSDFYIVFDLSFLCGKDIILLLSVICVTDFSDLTLLFCEKIIVWKGKRRRSFNLQISMFQKLDLLSTTYRSP
jgi:hypothetical protein